MDTAVRIIPNHKGDLIHEYIDYKGFGYITLVSNEVAKEDRFNSLYKQRKFILNDSLESLQELLSKTIEDNIVPGRLIVKEFREKEIPTEYQERLNKNMLYENALKPYIKDFELVGLESSKAYTFLEPFKNYPKNQGQRIIRFIDYDRTGKEQDVILKIDKIALPEFTSYTFDNNKTTIFRDTSSLKKNKEEFVVNKLNSSNKSVEFETNQQIKPQLKNDRFFPEDMTIWDFVKAALTLILFIVGGILLIGEALGLIDSGTSNEWRRP